MDSGPHERRSSVMILKTLGEKDDVLWWEVEC
jgi:hypothetical protein